MRWITREELLYLLRRAGYTMRCMPGGGISLSLSRIALDSVDDPRVAYGYTPVEVNREIPSSRDISLMDFVLPWLALIPDERVVMRRIVAHRMMWNPEKGRSIWSYRRLGGLIGASHVAIKMWDEQGLDYIEKGLRQKSLSYDKIVLYMTGFKGANSGYSEVGVAGSHRDPIQFLRL